jgi:putative polymerase
MLARTENGRPGRKPAVAARETAANSGKTSVLAGGILFSATLFNAVLAFVNAHVFAMGYVHVAVAQMLLTVASLLVVLYARPQGSTGWLIGVAAATGGFLLLSVMRGHLEPKYLADMLTILLFVMLGMAMRGSTLVRVILIVQGLLVAVAIWELISPGGFGDVFRVRDYYVNTRGFSDDSFWSEYETLFLAAERPTGRLIGSGLSLHRASSLFLEPVSLGNWTIVVTLAIAALKDHLRPRQIALLVAGNMILLFACDGRLAIAINLILLAAWPVLPRLPRWLVPLFLPLLFLALLAAWTTGLLAEQGDTLVGRFHYGFNYLLTLNAGDLLGLNVTGGTVAADSGWAYLVLTQSIFGLAAIWLALTLHTAPGTVSERRFVAGMAIFIALSLPVSYSIFSIKTAAVLWALYGYLLAQAAARKILDRPSVTPGRQRPFRLRA